MNNNSTIISPPVGTVYSNDGTDRQPWIYTGSEWKNPTSIMQADLEIMNTLERVDQSKIFRTSTGRSGRVGDQYLRYGDTYFPLRHVLVEAIAQNKIRAVSNILDCFGITDQDLSIKQRLSIYSLLVAGE